MGANKAPRISAILPTWNRAVYLKKALKALVGQTLERDEFEVLVVDDGSTDATRGVVERFTEDLPLIYLHQENSGIAAAKNLGIEHARAPILLFMDDDDIAGPSLLEEHLWSHERYPESRIAVLGRTELSSPIASKPLMHFVTEVGFYLFCYPIISPEEWLDYTSFWGGRSSCKTAFLRDHGLFNPVFRFGCEDIELGYRLSKFGLRVVYNPRAVSTMIRALSFDDFCRRVEKQGESNWEFSMIHPVEEVSVWGDIPRAQKRWSELKGEFDTILTRARHLDKIAILRADEGLALGDFLTSELHKAYTQSLDGCRWRGIAKAAAETEYTAPQQEEIQIRKGVHKPTPIMEHLLCKRSDRTWNKYTRSLELIEIDITYACNLKCLNCNRSCTQAPSKQQMSLEQLQKFINESIEKQIRWKTIRVLGGEPTLHPELLLILDLLTQYRRDFSSETVIRLVTNGFGKKVNTRLSEIGEEIQLENSSKMSRIQTGFSPFNVAPVDLTRFQGFDFSGGCWIASQCGMGLTPFGYYPCAIAGAIDRVFGFDKGRKHLPDPDDVMLDLFSVFCRLCGHFLENQRPLWPDRRNNGEENLEDAECTVKTDGEIMSPTWITAYESYNKKPPELTKY